MKEKIAGLIISTIGWIIISLGILTFDSYIWILGLFFAIFGIVFLLIVYTPKENEKWKKGEHKIQTWADQF